MEHYIIFDKDGKLLFLSTSTIEANRIPDIGMQISNQQQALYLSVLNSQLQDVVLVDGEIQIIDKYTPEELEAKQALEAKQILINQANSQIHRDEHLWNNQILWNRYTDEQKTILTNYYDDLIAVTRGESDILPTLTFKGL